MESLEMRALNRTLVDVVEEKLLQYLKDNDYCIGCTVPNEMELASSLGVARSVVREALSRLKMIGLIESHTRRGMIVREPSLVGGMRRLIDPRNLSEKTGSHEKPCGLCVDFCQSEQEKLSIYDATQQSPELFHFCIKGFSRCICRPIDKVVKDFILSVIHSCRYIIEGFIPKFSYFAIP